MTTSTFEFDMGRLGTQMATRPNGQAFLNEVLFALETYHTVVLDFADRVPTPSFADQCVGGLAMHLGLESFKDRVKLKNVAESARPLVRHVIISRSEMHKEQNLAHS
ncbi:STAS-like domain-containing protein [Comamonas odontotermitis]|uniref:STAS-like domain-containing protein n=1 Tax=Comamonas odontotermitis TaxID=379895 RepID=UPI003670756A